MKVTVKMLRKKLEGEVLSTLEHHSLVLREQELRGVTGGVFDPQNQTGTTPCGCPCVDDCQD